MTEMLRRFKRWIVSSLRGYAKRLGAAVRATANIVRPRYRAFPRSRIELRDHESAPLLTLDLASATFVHTADFLPDRCSFSGDSFRDSPHVEFVKAYLKAGDKFDPKSTRYYRLASRGRLPVPCKGRVEAYRRTQEFIYLVDRIRENGYRPREFGAIKLAACKDGSYAVVDGKHRLAVLLASNQDNLLAAEVFANELRHLYEPMAQRSIPRFLHRKSLGLMARLGPAESHPGMEVLSERIKSMHLETWADIYHPIPFPEFRKLTTQVSDATPYKRLELILANLGRLEGLKVLDLGCNLGFYSFSLARRGAEVTGVELRSDYHGISTAVAREYGVPVRFVNAGLSSELLDSIGRTDCTLCFSMLQWVIAKEGFEQGMALLKRISQLSNILFFDISVNEGKACLTCPPGREISFVHDLLQKNTAYDVIEYIGRVHPYKTDVRHVFVCRRTSATAP